MALTSVRSFLRPGFIYRELARDEGGPAVMPFLDNFDNVSAA